MRPQAARSGNQLAITAKRTTLHTMPWTWPWPTYSTGHVVGLDRGRCLRALHWGLPTTRTYITFGSGRTYSVGWPLPQQWMDAILTHHQPGYIWHHLAKDSPSILPVPADLDTLTIDLTTTLPRLIPTTYAGPQTRLEDWTTPLNPTDAAAQITGWDIIATYWLQIREIATETGDWPLHRLCTNCYRASVALLRYARRESTKPVTTP